LIVWQIPLWKKDENKNMMIVFKKYLVVKNKCSMQLDLIDFKWSAWTEIQGNFVVKAMCFHGGEFS
jgi:hypothetical protein